MHQKETHLPLVEVAKAHHLVAVDHQHVVFLGAVAEVLDLLVDGVVDGVFVVDAGALGEGKMLILCDYSDNCNTYWLAVSA